MAGLKPEVDVTPISFVINTKIANHTWGFSDMVKPLAISQTMTVHFIAKK